MARPRRTEPEVRLPADLLGPVDVELVRSLDTIPGPNALPGGTGYEPKWDGFFTELVNPGASNTVRQ
jgi:hypothetical protein